MNKVKLILCILFSLLLISCNKEVDNDYEVDYKEEIIDYDKMDSFNCYKVENDTKYEYTFYIENNRIINAQVLINFETEKIANDYYESIKENEEYINIYIENTSITYFHNLETFIYANYPKDILIDLLKENNFVFE